jgi:hypothetical protein
VVIRRRVVRVAQSFRVCEETTYNAEIAEPAEKMLEVFFCVFCEFCVQRRIPSQALQRCERRLKALRCIVNAGAIGPAL